MQNNMQNKVSTGEQVNKNNNEQISLIHSNNGEMFFSIKLREKQPLNFKVNDADKAKLTEYLAQNSVIKTVENQKVSSSDNRDEQINESSQKKNNPLSRREREIQQDEREQKMRLILQSLRQNYDLIMKKANSVVKKVVPLMLEYKTTSYVQITKQIHQNNLPICSEWITPPAYSKILKSLKKRYVHISV